MSETPNDSLIHRLVGELLEVPVGERERWLTSRLPNDGALRARLLAALGGAEAPAGGDLIHRGIAFGVALDEHDASVAPRLLGRYELIRPLGEGGMGTVLLAQDPHLSRQVAVKLLRADFDTDESRKRFWREARAVGQLRHENIVTIFDVQEDQGRPFIVMEYIAGRTLSEVITAREPLSLTRKLEIIESICSGLECAHRAGIVHRDIKPSNVIIADDGVVKILDFGIAKPLRQELGHGLTTLTADHAAIGTVGYMSPECLSGGQVDAKADMFAASAVAYELLTFHRPFGDAPGAVTRRVLTGDVAPMNAFVADLPDAVQRVVQRGLAVDPHDRFGDLAAMRQALSVARLEALSETATQPGKARPTWLTPALLVGSAAALAGLIMLALLVWTGQSNQGGSTSSAGFEATGVTGREAEPVPAAPGVIPRAAPLDVGARPRLRPPVPDQSPVERGFGGIDIGQPEVGNDARQLPDALSQPSNVALGGGRDTAQPAEPALPEPGTVDKSSSAFAAAGPPAAFVAGTALTNEVDTAIRGVLREFEAAFETLSTPALRSIQPSLTSAQLAVWERAFLDHTEYTVDIRDERVVLVTPERATVECVITQVLVPRRGEPRRLSGRATIVLEKNGGEWVISSVKGAGWQ